MEIYYWDGSTIQNISDNGTDDHAPSLYNGTIAWHGQDGTSDNDTEIYYWDGSTIQQITDNSTEDVYPSLYNGTIAWRGDDGSDLEIYYWDGSTIQNISDNGTIAWSSHDDGSLPTAEIYYWDGSTIHQITNNSTKDFLPSLYNGTIAWHGAPASDWEIYYWDGSTISRLLIIARMRGFPPCTTGKSLGTVRMAP